MDRGGEKSVEGLFKGQVGVTVKMNVWLIGM